MGKTVLDLYYREQYLFCYFFSDFAFKQAKEQILFQVQHLKMLKQNVFAHFRVTGCINKKCLYIEQYNDNIVRATSSSALVILITRL